MFALKFVSSSDKSKFILCLDSLSRLLAIECGGKQKTYFKMNGNLIQKILWLLGSRLFIFRFLVKYVSAWTLDLDAKGVIDGQITVLCKILNLV
jgi:hypothetical protein